MKVGFVGLGKLGLPVATAISYHHEVMGYDTNPERMSRSRQPFIEAGPSGKGDFNYFLERAPHLSFGTLEQVVDFADILFVAVQTPHEPRFEGVTPLPEDRADFDYSYLVSAIRQISAVVKKPTILCVICTVLPGTIRKRVLPVLNPNLRLVYNPFFIAMGTTMRDFIHPEFILLGSEDADALEQVDRFYETVSVAPTISMSIESAELAKTAYNTFISAKIGIVNTLMEVCHKTPGANIDQVTAALRMATRRVVGPQYMGGGMGDGGGCHPRDNIAMSWLARERGLSFDLFDAIMRAREESTRWLASVIFTEHSRRSLPLVLFGQAFKGGTAITTGSPAVLLQQILFTEFKTVASYYDPYVFPNQTPPERPVLAVISTKHPGFRDFAFPRGSVVIDPWRYIPEQDGVEVIQIGVGKK